VKVGRRVVHRCRGHQDCGPERDVYGGIIGQQYDPCYHEACDTFSNNSNEVLDLNSDAIAFATLTYAMDVSSVTGP